MKTPILFGVDPDEIWRFVPKAAREAGEKLPIFRLKAPSLAATVLREDLATERRKETNENAPGIMEELRELTGGTFKVESLGDGATDEEKAARTVKVAEFIRLNLIWNAAWSALEIKYRDRQEQSDVRILRESVDGWEGLPTGSGKVLDFAKVKDRIGEVLRGDLREEIIEAALAGTTVSDEDAEGLVS